MPLIKKPRKCNAFNDEFEPPETKLVSHGDLLIKELAEKQKRTDITLKEALASEKEFERASNFVPITNYLSGKSSLSQFEDATETSERVETFNRLDFSSDDIQLLDDWNQGEDFVFNKHKNSNPELLKARIEKLLDLLNKEQDKSGESLAGHSRDFTECALSVKPESVETKLLKFALQNKRKSVKGGARVLDDIKQVEKDLFPPNNEQNVSRIRRRARKLANRLNTTGGPVEKSTDAPIEFKTKWDLKTSEKQESSPSKVTKTYSCKQQNFYTVKDGEIIKIKPLEEETKVVEVQRQKLSIEKIKEIPKFRNYEPGECSKKLYIKNLPANMTEERLKSICESSNVPNIESYQLMQGKMNGTAFIHLPDKISAALALEELNGLVIKNKPMIVAFGKVKI